jgi:hypothetical protein
LGIWEGSSMVVGLRVGESGARLRPNWRNLRG